MFVLASLMALAAAGTALELTGSRIEDEGEDDRLDPSPVLGAADPGEIGNVSSGMPESGFPGPPPDPEPPVDLADDLILGGAGADDLFAGAGDDTVHAGAGNDWVQGDGDYGVAGNDDIHGGAGSDLLAGQGGHDIVWGEEGDDTIMGGEGDDTLFGGSGNDWLSGHDGHDVLASGGGADDLDGGRGDDLLTGDDESGTVWMHGGDGNDTLMPGTADFAEGQGGADRFVLRQTLGPLPVIADFDAREDQLVLHLPDSVAQTARIDLAEDEDGTMLVTVNGEAIGRMLQAGGLAAADIVVMRLPG